MSSSGPVVGLLGCGRWGAHVLRDLLALGCEVLVVDPDPAARHRAAGASAVVGDAGSLGPCDGYVVATPASTHAEVVGSLLGTGRPVFVEKPFTTDPDSAASLAAAGAGRVFVMEKWRYHPAVGTLRDLAGSGELGAVLEVRTRRWSTSRSQHDVGAEWTLAPHDLSVLDELAGPLTAVASASAVVREGRVERLTADVVGAVLGCFDVWDAAPTVERSVDVVGRDATARWSSTADDVVEVERFGEAPAQRRVPVAEPPLLAELREFVGHLRGGPPPRSSAASGARSVALVDEAVRRAAAA